MEGMLATGRTVDPMFHRLPRGPNGFTRTQVGRNQRARLYGAMVESVARRGFRRTRIADLTGLAGVSTRAFYEQFRSKEDCLLATHNHIVARARTAAITSAERQLGWSNQLYSATKRLFDEAAAHPDRASLVLVHSLEITPHALDRLCASSLALERPLALLQHAATGERRALAVPACAVVGGLRRLAFSHLRAQRAHALSPLAEAAVNWTECYRAPQQLRALIGPRRVADARQLAPWGDSTSPRTRSMRALIALASEEGYAGITDAAIARRARLPVQALHRNFPTKATCLHAIIDTHAAEAVAVARTAITPATPWPTQVHRAVSAYLVHLAERESLTRLAFVDLLSLGSGAAAHLDVLPETLIRLITDNAPSPHAPAAFLHEAITGALGATIARVVIANRTRQLPAIADQLAFLLLAPYIGPRNAIRAIAASSPA